MKAIRVFLFSFLVLANSAFANTFTTDLTDLWWKADESGWGVTATHQREIVFLTFFVYGTDNRPTWYTGQASYTGQSSQGALIFSGDMYQTSGPWLGTFFNPDLVGVRKVGTVTFTAFVSSATLTYSVDGTFVSKAVTRQTFRANDLTGEYAGIFRETISGCSNSSNNGTYETPVGISITTSGNSFTMVSNSSSSVCNYTGNYTQTGRMGRSQGTYTCPGVSGTYDFIEIEATPSSVSGRFSAGNNVCSQDTGHFAFAKRL